MTDLDVAKDRRVHKDERIHFRVSAEVKHTLLRAAEVTGRSLSDFVAFSAFNAAQKTIDEVDRMHLAEQDRAVFLDALFNPPEPNEALKAAAARHQKIIK